MSKRAKIGDIIEILTSKGFAYAQYTHQHATHGGLIRVFDVLLEERPHNISDLIKIPIRFSTFFPVNAVISKGIFTVAGHEAVAPHNQSFPIFRGGNADTKTKKVSTWWFWDGKKEWKVGEITQEQRKMPIVGIWNDTLLIKRIEEGWRPENDPR